MVHVDEFIDGYKYDSDEERYARFFFLLARLPAVLQMQFGKWTEQYKLYCTYQGKRYRVTGASRLGDIWLTTDMNQVSGYELRVDLADCSDWSEKEE